MSDYPSRLEDELRDERSCNDRHLRLKAADEIDRLMVFVGFVESWVSQPVGAFSVSALDGLFGMTRDRIHGIYKRRSEAQRNG